MRHSLLCGALLLGLTALAVSGASGRRRQGDPAAA